LEKKKKELERAEKKQKKKLNEFKRKQYESKQTEKQDKLDKNKSETIYSNDKKLKGLIGNLMKNQKQDKSIDNEKKYEENENNTSLFDIERTNEQKNKTSEIEFDTNKQNMHTKGNDILDDDVRKVLEIADNLLEKLPEEVIDKFASSKDFEIYEKVITKYKIK